MTYFKVQVSGAEITKKSDLLKFLAFLFFKLSGNI